MAGYDRCIRSGKTSGYVTIKMMAKKDGSRKSNQQKTKSGSQVLYLRDGLDLDGALYIFLLSAALLISEKHN